MSPLTTHEVKRMKVTCPYCRQQAELVLGCTIYPHRPGLRDRKFWLCRPCDAYVGTHINSKRHAPLGTMANEELRFARRELHKVFDPIWRDNRKKSRSAAYRWLAKRLHKPENECHIGSFSLEDCEKAMAVIHLYNGGRAAYERKRRASV